LPRFVKSPKLKLTAIIVFIVVIPLLFAQEIGSIRTPFFSSGRTGIDLDSNTGFQSTFSYKGSYINHFVEISSVRFKHRSLPFQGSPPNEKTHLNVLK